METEIVIAGGGIIGLYTAYSLLDRGLHITLIDRGSFGRESSWAAGGILAPLLPWQYDNTITDLTDNAAQSYARLAAQLLNETGIEIEYWPCGLMVLDSKQHLEAQRWCQQHGHRCQVKAPLFIDSACEPGLFLADISQVRSPRLIKALVTYLRQCGVELLADTTLQSCKIKNDQIIGVTTSRGEIHTRKLVWATGAWTQQLSEVDRSITLPTITPIRGQILAFDGRNIGLDTILYGAGHYLIPRRDGLILAGSTLEDVGFDQSVTETAHRELREKSLALFPALASCNVVHQWSGLRPASPNNRPTIGPHPHIEGLYINSGHFRYGIAMAPRSAEIITSWILESDNTSLNTTYQPQEVPAL